MGLLVNIDNGGTLTDIFVSNGVDVWRTKTLTTPADLSRCLIDGLAKMSSAIYGETDLERLLLATDYIRYSTTQGTNALVQRDGPRLGLVCGGGIRPDRLRQANPDVFDALVGDRAVELAVDGDERRFDAVRAVSDLSARGANRIVVAFGGEVRDSAEMALKQVLLRAFPPHLLGAVPVLYSHEIVGDEDDVRRAWTALFNAFLHPAMERFLYSAERRLRDARAQQPLLIFRNDGQSARVAKTIAVKTYSSGPRGGAEGAQALAGHYGFDRLISIDIGGTTTDISLVEDRTARAHARGLIENVETSFPLTDVFSAGVGGSSIIRVEGGKVIVGPESVGSAPGPACFGLGGTRATITDALFAAGLLDPASYFGGKLTIDVDRARAAIMREVAEPLGLSEAAAIEAMEAAWIAKVAESVRAYCPIEETSVLAAFGGAGPLIITRIAEALGINRVIIPQLAAVFSAFGIGFSDIGHTYEQRLSPGADVTAEHQALLTRARRGMFAEGLDADACQYKASIVTSDGTAECCHGLDAALPADAERTLRIVATMALPRPVLTGAFADGAARPATAAGQRRVQSGGVAHDLALFRAETLDAGSGGSGPAVLEEEFFTCRIDAGWRFVANEAGDVLITRLNSGSAA